MSDDLKKAAIEYAERGWLVFPLGFKSKAPAKARKDGGKGLYGATNDVEAISKWWDQHSNHNIGINVGDSGLYVVDVDGERGERSLKELLETQYPFPPTLTALTGKGRHFYFKMPDGMELGNSASRIGPNIDTRGKGGYVVAPPSLHPDGGIYDWQDSDVEIAELPEWVLEHVRQITWMGPKTTVGVHPYVRQVWENIQTELRQAQQGRRNDALNVAAKKIGNWVASNSFPLSLAEVGLQQIAQDLGLSDHEIMPTIHSGLEAGMKTPCYPPDPQYFSHESTQQQSARQAEGTLNIRKGSTYGRKELQYLWGTRIPLGKLTIIAGPAGIGKSYMTLALAAHITNGTKLIDNPTPVDGEVIFCTYEDDIEDTVGKRCDLLDVNMDRMFIIENVDTEHGSRPFGPQDVPRVIDFLKGRPDVKLIVIDPLGSFLGAGVDVNAENQARAVLGSLVDAAAEHDCAVVVCAHYNKSTDSADPLHRIAGSQGITALPRSVLMVEWGEDGDRLVKHAKSNTARASNTISYRFDDTFAWGRVVHTDDECKRFVEDTLAINDGEVTEALLWKRAMEFGYVDEEIDRGVALTGCTYDINAQMYRSPTEHDRGGYDYDVPAHDKLSDYKHPVSSPPA